MKTMDECADPVEGGEPSREAGAGASAGPTTPSSPATRVVARVIDPSVRDDGRGDPQFTSEVRRERTSAAAGTPSAHHPVRERLLARARAAIETSAVSANLPAAPDPRPLVAGESRPTESREEPIFGFESVPEVGDDLDLIGAPERPRPERTPHQTPRLPPPTALLLGTLAGLVAIASLFGALIYFDPHEPLRISSPPAPVVEAPAPVAPEEPPPPSLVGNVQRPPRARVQGPWRIANAAAEGARQKVVSSSMGDRSFLGATQAVGVSLKDAYRVLTVFEGIKNLDRCRPKDTFTALLDAESGRLTAFEYVVSEEEVYQARAGQDGRLTARRLDLDVQRHRAQGVVVLDGGFEDSARRSGFEPGLGDYVNKALSSYVSINELRAGDVLGVVAQEVTVLGEFSRYAGVEALEYRPVGGEPLRVYYHEASRGYVDSRGRAFGKSRWTRPVPGAGVTSRYNPKRMHPILKRIKPHNGTDFGAPVGTPVVAAASGKVSFVGRAGPNGNMVTIAHMGGYQTGYSHLSRFAKGLKVGTNVEQKQLIGYVGSTGRSTGPHLHFSAKKSGRFVDPESLNLDGLARLAQDQRLPNDQRRRYDRMLDALKLPEANAARVARGEPAAPGQGSLQVEIAAARVAPTPADPAAGALAAASSAAPPGAGAPASVTPVSTLPAPAVPGASPAATSAPVSASSAPTASPAAHEPEDTPPATIEPDVPSEPAPPDPPGEGGPPADEDLLE